MYQTLIVQGIENVKYSLTVILISHGKKKNSAVAETLAESYYCGIDTH